MRLYIIRHADPDYSIDGLTEAGHVEAKALAPRMQHEGITEIYASPMGRARATAQYSADALGLNVKIEEWAAELEHWRIEDSQWSCVMAWDWPAHLIREDYRNVRHDNWHEIPSLDNPEFRQDYQRVCDASDNFLARLGYTRDQGRYRVEHDHRRRIAFFCHNGLGLTWLSHLLAIPLPLVWAGFWLSPSSVTTILMDARCDQWATPRALCVGDTSHLYHAGLEIQPSGIKANYD